MINTNRVKQMVLAPANEWSLIATETQSESATIKDYLIYLLALSALIEFISLAVIGQGFLFASYKMAAGSALLHVVGRLIASLVLIWLLARVVSMMAPTFGGTANNTAAFRLLAYASTVPILSQVLGLLPFIGGLLAFAGALYGLYVLYLGMAPMMRNPAGKSLLYTVATVVAAIVMSILVFMVMGLFLPKPSGDLKLTGPGGEMTIGGDKLDAMDKRLEEFNKKMEQAKQSGDPTLAAKTAVESLAGLVAGKDAQSRKPLTMDALKSHIPEQLAGFERSQFSTQTNKILGIDVASAKANYQNADQYFSVEITDMGTAAALASAVSWAAGESEKQTSTSTEKTYREGKRVINEKSRNDGSSASYKLLLSNGVVIDATGRKMTLDQLKGAVAAMDLDKLEAAQ